MLLNIVVGIIFLFVIIVVFSAFNQKDTFTKILYLNISTTLSALFICCIGTYTTNSSYIDIALIYFILSIISVSAYLKYFIQKKNEQK